MQRLPLVAELIHASRVAGPGLRDLRQRRAGRWWLEPAALVCAFAAGSAAHAAPTSPEPKPPRLDGPYVGGMLLTGLTVPRVNGLDAGAMASFGGSLRFGEVVLPWLGLGLSLGGAAGVRSGDARQTLGQGQMLVDTTFIPLAKRRVPLSLRAAFGFGGGAILQAGREGRAGFGGAVFSAAAGYTLFPWVQKRRAFRGGGFGLGPELGWIGFTPTGPGNPMSHTIYVALTTTFYFGS